MRTVPDGSSSRCVSLDEAERANAALGPQVDQVRKIMDEYRAIAEALSWAPTDSRGEDQRPET
jgi:hypothetical protein